MQEYIHFLNFHRVEHSPAICVRKAERSSSLSIVWHVQEVNELLKTTYLQTYQSEKAKLYERADYLQNSTTVQPRAPEAKKNGRNGN